MFVAMATVVFYFEDLIRSTWQLGRWQQQGKDREIRYRRGKIIFIWTMKIVYRIPVLPRPVRSYLLVALLVCPSYLTLRFTCTPPFLGKNDGIRVVHPYRFTQD
ncbi:hypothetical protein BDW42DRAFT_174071 [Aspergillus taichungensis]|uniref:Uncharacterized protein n=1 Tax=Aspergillus taichungensis TaxID=482145 RepID=A0A2J5HNR2_9EURO|nr:hypothetical protein BDW42DRAFT_174071 [Aspergillus taichungensis]